MATHSSILFWRFPRMEEPGELQSMGSQRVRHDWVTNTYTHTKSLYVTWNVISWKIILQNIDEMSVICDDREWRLFGMLLKGCNIGGCKRSRKRGSRSVVLKVDAPRSGASAPPGNLLKCSLREFPGTPVVWTPHFHLRGGLGLIPGWGLRSDKLRSMAEKKTIQSWPLPQTPWIRDSRIKQSVITSLSPCHMNPLCCCCTMKCEHQLFTFKPHFSYNLGLRPWKVTLLSTASPLHFLSLSSFSVLYLETERQDFWCPTGQRYASLHTNAPCSLLVLLALPRFEVLGFDSLNWPSH